MVGIASSIMENEYPVHISKSILAPFDVQKYKSGVERIMHIVVQGICMLLNIGNIERDLSASAQMLGLTPTIFI